MRRNGFTCSLFDFRKRTRRDGKPWNPCKHWIFVFAISNPKDEHRTGRRSGSVRKALLLPARTFAGAGRLARNRTLPEHEYTPEPSPLAPACPPWSMYTAQSMTSSFPPYFSAHFLASASGTEKLRRPLSIPPSLPSRPYCDSGPPSPTMKYSPSFCRYRLTV